MKYIVLILMLFTMGCASKGVIGVKYDRVGLVHFVYNQSPADKAGIKPGDVILNSKELRGTVGSEILVKYLRNTKECSILVKRVHIDSLDDEMKWKINEEELCCQEQ